jgi:hypothetical protein
MAEISVRPQANEISISTANTVYSNGLIRLVNSNTNASLISIAANGVVYATLTIRGGETLYVQKNYTDTLVCNASANVLACPVRRGTI